MRNKKPNVLMVTELPDRGHSIVELDSDNYLTNFIRTAFESNGINGVKFIPEFNSMQTELKFADMEMHTNLITALKPDRMNILGVNTYTPTLQSAWNLIEQARMQKVPLMVIGGGPHFVDDRLIRDGKPFSNSIETAVEAYDGVIAGGLASFIEVIRAVSKGDVQKINGRYVPKNLPKGYFYVHPERGVVGSGKSEGVNLNYAPVKLLRGSDHYGLELMLSNYCNNGCGFCRNGTAFKFSPDQLYRGINKALQGLYDDEKQLLQMVLLNDPNPFSESNRKHTEECLKMIQDEFGKLHIASFYDSAAFMDPKKVFEDVLKWKLRGTFVGRETVTESAAEFMGERYCKKAKDQDMLNEEKKGLTLFFKAVRDSGVGYCVRLSYVLTPVETAETIAATFQEMEHFSSFATPTFKAVATYGLLEPLPGTEIVRRYTNLLSDNPFTCNNFYDAWDGARIKAQYPNSVFGLMKRNNMFNNGQDVVEYSPEDMTTINRMLAFRSKK